MTQSLKAAIRVLLRQPVFAPLFGWLLGRRLRLLYDSDAPDALTVLVFSELRWRQDLTALARAGGLRLYGIDHSLQRRISSLFAVPGKTLHTDYFSETDSEVLRMRTLQARFVARLVPALHRRMAFDCAITPTVHYREEHPWAEGFDKAGLPFVALHKEFTVLDERHLPERIQRFRGRRQRFLGSHVCVTNSMARRLFIESGVFPGDRISTVGLLRMDNLLSRDRTPVDRPTRPAERDRSVVTLFSFGHISGGITATQWRSHYFSMHDEIGFVELFRNVHVAFAELALRHPEVTFKIKPKNVEDWWICEIEAVVEQALGRSLDQIPNCSIVAEPAPALIAQSCATIGFNSTVLLESVAMGCNTIMPVFEEAIDAYPHNVYFPDFRDVFAIAGSKAEYMALIERAIAGETLNHAPDARRAALFRYYLGYDDGRTAERAAAVLHDIAARRRPPISFAQDDVVDAEAPQHAPETLAAMKA